MTVRPEFWTDESGRYCARVDIEDGTSLYGTGEVAGPLLRNGRKIICWNTDAYGYTEDNPSLYQSHPWVLAVREDGTSFGVFADTTWRCEIDLTDGIVFRGEGAPYYVYIIEHPTPQGVVQGLAALVGTMPMPPEWAIGYHQCRYSYYPESRVREIAREFRDRDIPCDVIWMDIDYMHDFRTFTFDPVKFPDPTSLNSDLADQGFWCIWMINPGIKDEEGYWVHDSGEEQDVWVRRANGEVYRGEVWPGWCVFPDYTRPEVRAWWRGLYKDFMATGIDGVWNDMNEPAIFNVRSKTMPEDNRHEGGAWDYGGTLPPGPHLQYHNVYGLMMAKGTYDAISELNPDKRPFVLTRAGYMGSHRYAATWTGDNSAEWDDLEASVPMALNLGLSGQPFSGPDIGGFAGNGDGEMFARWMGAGVFLPFARGHTGKGNIDKEPWAFDERVERICRISLERRYRLMPYLYTLFHEASINGMPVARPVFFADPTDPALRSEDDAFLLGRDVLIVPHLTPNADRKPVEPKGVWRKFDLVGEGFDEPDLPIMKLRAGAIVPVGPKEEYTAEKDYSPLTLLVSLNDRGRAEGRLYEDAKDGFGFEDDDYLVSSYEAVESDGVVTVRMVSALGNRERLDRNVIVRVLRDDGTYVEGRGKDGEPIRVRTGEN